jgi:hypothetical protein
MTISCEEIKFSRENRQEREGNVREKNRVARIADRFLMICPVMINWYIINFTVNGGRNG